MTSTEVGFDVLSLVRPAVRAVPSYVPAKLPAERPAREIKLDMNESPWGPSPKARAVLASFEQTHRYPDFHASELREALAGYAGVPAEQRSQLFQRFATGQRRTGTGLGLFIVRELARAHGGEARYEPPTPTRH